VKTTLTFIAVLIIVFFAGWFLNGARTDAQWRESISGATVVGETFDRYIDVPVPGKPFPVPGKPVKDTAGIARALDSLHGIYQDSLAVQRHLAEPFTGVHKDSNLYLRMTGFPITKSFRVDSLWLAPVKYDSTVVSKIVIDPRKDATPFRTIAAATIGAAAGSAIANIPGAAIGSLVGFAFDWMF